MYLKKQELTFQTEKYLPEDLQIIIDENIKNGFSLIERNIYTINETTKCYYEIVLVFERP